MIVVVAFGVSGVVIGPAAVLAILSRAGVACSAFGDGGEELI
jgi:hypothetical protein